jgi:hypothetical protein
MKLGSAANTYAIVVGIECYRQAGWTLNGPAMDALRMANWLLEKGVPPGNVKVLINEDTNISEVLGKQREQLKAGLRDAGVELRQNPTRQELDDTLKPWDLPTTDGIGDRTLILYLGGHGLWEGGDAPKRYLVAADASERECHVVNLTGIANLFAYYNGVNRFHRQWIIQDICATLPGGLNLRCLAFQGSPRTAPVNRQYIFSATRPGQAAGNDQVRQTGFFSSALMEVLASRDTLEGLDVEEVRTAMNASPWALNNRMPVSFRDDNMEEQSQVLGSLATDHVALAELERILGTSQWITTDFLLAISRRFLRGTAERPTRPLSLLQLLDGLVAPEDCGLTNVEQFAIHLHSVMVQVKQNSGNTNCDADIEKVCNWILKWPGARDGPAVNQVKRQFEYENERMADADHIIIDLCGSQNTNETRVWMYFNDESTDLEPFPTPQPSLTERLRSVLEQLCARGVYGAALFEVVVPAADLFQPYTGLEFIRDDVPAYLGHGESLMALRILERWTDERWNRLWKRQWKDARVNSGRPPKMAWLASGTAIAGSDWLWHGTGYLDTQRADLERLLKQGAACAAWCEPMHMAQVTTIVESGLFVRLHQTRIELAALNTQGQHGITCIFDNPDRIPDGAGGFSSRFMQPS